MGPRLRRPREAAGCACASSVLSRACAISHSLPFGNARNSPAQSAGFLEVLMRVQYATSSSNCRSSSSSESAARGGRMKTSVVSDVDSQGICSPRVEVLTFARTRLNTSSILRPGTFSSRARFSV